MRKIELLLEKNCFANLSAMEKTSTFSFTLVQASNKYECIN